jgi:hypothetical protein
MSETFRRRDCPGLPDYRQIQMSMRCACDSCLQSMGLCVSLRDLDLFLSSIHDRTLVLHMHYVLCDVNPVCRRLGKDSVCTEGGCA